MRTVVIGGTSGIGLEVAGDRAARGDEVVLTGRDPDRAAEVAALVGGSVSGIAVDLNDTHGLADALAGVGEVDRLVVAAIERDQNTISEYDVDRATKLAVLKLVGYTEVIHTLLPRMNPESSVVLFGGRAKDRPYPGSITVSTVNGGVVGLVNALALEMAPIRVNALHPGIVGDSPFWAGKPDSVMDGYVSRTPTKRLASMADIVGAVDFLLENRSVNATNLYVDGGWLVT
jgi:NAD(P)-dependent dehydrogenase (short-subunit alcohol dehydrogenase family)